MDPADGHLNLSDLHTHLALGCLGLVNSFQRKPQSNKRFSGNPTSFLRFSSALNALSPLDLYCLVPLWAVLSLALGPQGDELPGCPGKFLQCRSPRKGGAVTVWCRFLLEIAE